MIERLLPSRIDGSYSGHKLALWLLGAVALVKTAQSLAIFVDGYATVASADGVPLDTFTSAEAQAVVGLFGLSAVSRLVMSLLAVLVLVRYRSAAPLMLLVLALDYLGRQLVLEFHPLIRMGTPPGPLVNLALFVLSIVGLALSLWRRSSPQTRG